MLSSTPGFPVHHQLLELAQTHVPLLLASIFPSIRVFSDEICHILIEWQKQQNVQNYWSEIHSYMQV